MISLYQNQHAIWILLHILNYATSVEYGTIWTNLNKGQPTRIPTPAPGKACQWPYYDNNLNEINGSKQQPYINYGTIYGKVNKTNFGNYETINNKHGADPVYRDDLEHIIKNIKDNVRPYSSRKVVSLIGYDDEIYNIIHNIIVAGHTGPVVVYFYLYQTYKYFNIGRLRTYPHILDQILSKYNHFNCINSNQIMIPRENSILYADECIQNCDNLGRELNRNINNLKESTELYLDFFENDDVYDKANCQYNVIDHYKNCNYLNESNNSPAMINSLWLPQNNFKILTNITLHDPYKFVEKTKPNVQSKVIHLNNGLNGNISMINNKNKHILANLPNNCVVNKFLEKVNTIWMDKYYSNKPGRDIYDTKDAHPDLYNELMLGPKEIITLEQAQPCHLENNVSNKVGILTANKKLTKVLHNTVPLEENDVNQESNKPNINYDLSPISNQNTDSYLAYRIIQYPKQIYNTDIDEISVNNRSSCNPFCINNAKDQNTHTGQNLVPYELTGSYETSDDALASNQQYYEIVPFQEQYSNLQLVAEANSSIPKALAYSFIKPEINIQKICSTDLTNANIDHLNPIEPNLLSTQTETFDSNPTLNYMKDTDPDNDMQMYDLIQMNENKAPSKKKLSANPLKLNTLASSLPKTNQYILSEKAPIVYIPACTNTPPALKWPGFYSQKELPHLENVLLQRPTSPPSFSLANTKPVQTMYNENTNSYGIPSVSYTQFSSDFPYSKLMKETIPTKHIPSLEVSLKPYYKTFETTIKKNPLQLKTTSLSSPISYLSNLKKKQQYILNKPAKFSSNLSFNIPYTLVPIQWDKTSTLESNIKDMSLQDQNKSNLKYDDKSHLIQTHFDQKYKNLLPCNCNTNIQDTPYVNFAQLPQLSNIKHFIKPNIDDYDPANKNKINLLITPLKTKYQATPKGKTILSSDVEYVPSKIPSLCNNIEPFKITPKFSNTNNTMSYLTNVEIPKLPLKISLNSEKKNIFPFTYPRHAHKNLPTWTQIYYNQPIDDVPNQSENQNLFDDAIKSLESNKSQEKEPKLDLNKTIINSPNLKYKVFDAPNENIAKYYSSTQSKPSYLPTNNRPFDIIPNVSFTNIYNISTPPNKTPHSQYSLISEPQNESNIGQSISEEISKPCNFPLMSQIFQTYEPKSSEVLKHHHKPISYSKTMVPKSISPQRKLQDFRDLNFPLPSSTIYEKHPPYGLKGMLHNLQAENVYTSRMHQNLPTWTQKYCQPISIEHQNLFDHSFVNIESDKDQVNASIMDLRKTINKPYSKYNFRNLPHENTAKYYAFSKPSYFPTNYDISTSPSKPPKDQYLQISNPHNEINNEGFSISNGIAKPCNNLSMSHIWETYEPKIPMVLQQFYQEPISLLQTLVPELVSPQSKVTDLHISKPYIEINKGQNISDGGAKPCNFPLMSQILQTSEPKSSEILKHSKHHEPILYYSKTLVPESLSPQSKQPDFEELDYSLASGTSYGKPPLYLPYDLKSKLLNVQPAKVSTATYHQSNLNFNQARNIKEVYLDNLYRQPNEQGLLNLTHKGPVSSTPYIHKHLPFEYTNPMGKILPRTLYNDLLEPKPQIKFTTISKPMKNTFEQIIPYENISHYIGNKNNKIPKQIIEEVNEHNPKTSILQDIHPHIINTIKFYDPLICKPHTTSSSQTNPSLQLKLFNLNRYPTTNLKEIISLQTLKTQNNLPHTISQPEVKSSTLPVTYELVSTKQPFISNVKNNIKYYTESYSPSLIITDTNLFNRKLYGQEINSQKPAQYKSRPYSGHKEETPIKYYKPQFFKQNDFKGSTFNKPQSTKLSKIQHLQFYERPKELMSPQTETQQLLKNSNENRDITKIKDEIPTDLTHIHFDIEDNNKLKDSGKLKLWPGRYLNPYTTTNDYSIVNSSPSFNYLPKESSTTSFSYLNTSPSMINDKKLQSENSFPRYQINKKGIKEKIPTALLTFSSAPVTDQRKYNSWAAKYSAYLSNLSPNSNNFTFDTKGKTSYPSIQDIFIKSTKNMPQLRSFIQKLLPNLQQKSYYSSPLSRNQENNLYEINDVIEEDTSKKPVSNIQSKGKTSGVKYDLMVSKNVCLNSSTDPTTTIMSTPIAVKSYRPSCFGYTPKISWNISPQTKTPFISKINANPSTKFDTISTSTQTPILNTKPSLKIWSNLYKNSPNSIEPVEKEDIENIGTHKNGDILYNPYLYQRPESKASLQKLFSATFFTPTLVQNRKLQQNSVAYCAPSYQILKDKNKINNLGDTNKDMSKHNIPAYRVLRTDNDKMTEKYYLEYLQQPTNPALQTQPSSVLNSLDPLSANSLDETSVLPFSQIHAVSGTTENLSNLCQAFPPKGASQNINVAPQLTENTLNLFATDIHTPNTFRISSNMPQDNLGATAYYQPGIAVPTVMQSLGNILAIKQTPVHFYSKPFKNNINYKNVNLPQNVIRLKPIQGQYSQDTKEFMNLKENYRMRPFKQCKNCDCKVCVQNPTIMDQIIKQVYNYSKTLPDSKVYEPHTGFTNDKITIPLGEMGLAKYEITKPNEYFVKTEIPGLLIRAWGSKIKIIQPKLVFDVKEYEGFNFMPVIENHYYSPEFAQNVAKDIVTRLYGEPIVINGVYDTSCPYAIINDINNGLVNDGKAYILWPTLCNCGCMRSGCKCCFGKYGW